MVGSLTPHYGQDIHKMPKTSNTTTATKTPVVALSPLTALFGFPWLIAPVDAEPATLVLLALTDASEMIILVAAASCDWFGLADTAAQILVASFAMSSR